MFPDPTPGLPYSVSLCLPPCRPALAHLCGFHSALSHRPLNFRSGPLHTLFSLRNLPTDCHWRRPSFWGAAWLSCSPEAPACHSQPVPFMSPWAESGPGVHPSHMESTQRPSGPRSHFSQPSKLCTKWYFSSHTQVSFHQTCVWVSSRAFLWGTHWLLELGHGQWLSSGHLGSHRDMMR